MSTMQRFKRWRQAADDAAKEHYLAEVGGGCAEDATALERVNRDHSWRLKAPITEATVRMWVGEDAEFAQALKVARQHREEGRRRAAAEPTAPVDPALWHTMGRLDQRPDPFRVARTVEDLLGGQL